jgi:hypothetical protein
MQISQFWASWSHHAFDRPSVRHALPTRRWLPGAAGSDVAGGARPAGDLDALRRHAAGDADRSLSMFRRALAAGGKLGPVWSEAGDLVVAAGLIQDAGASAVMSMSRRRRGARLAARAGRL